MTTFIDNLFGEYTSHAFLPTLTEAVECGTPAGLVEVLSKSTKDYDQSEKFAFYRTITSFQEYLLVDQYHYAVQHYAKTGVKKWEFQEYDTLEEEIQFSTVPCAIALSEIYDKVELEDRTNDLV